jgi:hypothetical protein
MRKTIVTVVVLCCVVLSAVLAGHPALAAEAGDAQRKAAGQALVPEGRQRVAIGSQPSAIRERAPAPQPRAADVTTLNERVIALEKENLVLREDLGKARLDLRTGLADQTKEMGRMQQRVDELNAQLAAEREKQSKRSRNMWIAIGVLALGIVAAN